MFENLFKRFRAPAVMAEGMPYSQKQRAFPTSRPVEPGYAPSVQEDAAPEFAPEVGLNRAPVGPLIGLTNGPTRDPYDDVIAIRRLLDSARMTAVLHRIQINALTKACARHKRTIRNLRAKQEPDVTIEVNVATTAVTNPPPVAEALLSRTMIDGEVVRTTKIRQATDDETRTFLLMLREQGAQLQVWHLWPRQRGQAELIAAAAAGRHWGEHAYMTGNPNEFQAHPWVIDAIEHALTAYTSADGQWDDIDPNSSLLCPIHLYRVKP